ncbi:hypothetical protein M0R45_014253 [Rubus argutus]|uniref:peroxidase n=1 Tax=Rubus argutus TaxID=59490 RepID=A0AAW1XME0_RUBAR
MAGAMKAWLVFGVVVVIFSAQISWNNPSGESKKKPSLSSSSSSSSSSQEEEPLELVTLVSLASSDGGQDFFMETTADVTSQNLEYDFYRDTCPQAEAVVRSRMARIYSQHKNVSAHLLRLFFHDCFIEGCDASVLLDDSNGNKNHAIEKQAIPNKSLKGFDKIDQIKEVLEMFVQGWYLVPTYLLLPLEMPLFWLVAHSIQF